MANDEQLRPPCHRCSRVLGRSCCEAEAGEPLATLTEADLHRVREATRLSAARFCETEVLTLDEAVRYERRRPIYRGYFREGPYRLTLKSAEGACVFFRPGEGCGLPASVRPTACLLYPFEPWPDGSFGLQVERFGQLARAAREGPSSACLAVEEAATSEALARALGTTLTALGELTERLRQEVGAHRGARATRSAG